MGDVVIKISVPDGKEESFKMLVEEMARYYSRRHAIPAIIDELKGSIRIDKPWHMLKEEVHEQEGLE